MHLGVLWFLLYNITVAIDTVGVSLNHHYGPSSSTCSWAGQPMLAHDWYMLNIMLSSSFYLFPFLVFTMCIMLTDIASVFTHNNPVRCAEQASTSLM